MGRGTLLVIAAALLLTAASGILLPAPTRALLPVAVAAPEVSAWLLVAAGLLGLLAVRSASGPGRAALVLALITAALALRPLSQAPAAGRQIDDALRSAFGAGYLDRIDPTVFASLRPRGVIVPELFLGIGAGPASPVFDVPFGAPGGQALTMRVYRTAAATAPVVLQFYGGAWQRGVPGDDPVMARYLAARGYLVCAADYRHAPRWRWPAQLEDVHSALAWVRAHAADYGGDGSRVAVIGRSAGGHLALMAAYTAGEPGVRAVVSLYGPTDLARGYRELPRPDPIGVRATLEALMGGPPEALPERYREASPAAYASTPQPPTLQIVGGRDHVVLPRFPTSLDVQLRAAGNRSVLITLPWAEHAFDAVPFGPGAQLALYAAERFLAVTLARDALPIVPVPSGSPRAAR